MSKVTNFQARKSQKGAEKAVSRLFSNLPEESLTEYISIMRMVWHNQSDRNGVISVECFSDFDGVFRDEQGRIINHKKFFDNLEEEVEKQDLFMSGLIHLAPEKIKLENSEKLDEYFLHCIKEIFGSSVEIQTP